MAFFLSPICGAAAGFNVVVVVIELSLGHPGLAIANGVCAGLNIGFMLVNAARAA